MNKLWQIARYEYERRVLKRGFWLGTLSVPAGIGLAIVKKIVQSHRGTVEAAVSAQGGAEFQIHLPL